MAWWVLKKGETKSAAQCAQVEHVPISYPASNRNRKTIRYLSHFFAASQNFLIQNLTSVRRVLEHDE
jgi:hypothetical protein